MTHTKYSIPAVMTLLISSTSLQCMESSQTDSLVDPYSRIKCLWDLKEQPYSQAALEIIEELVEKGADQRAQIKYIKKVGEYLKDNPFPVNSDVPVPDYIRVLVSSVSAPTSVEEAKEALKEKVKKLYDQLISSFTSPDTSPAKSGVPFEEDVKKIRVKFYFSNFLEQLHEDTTELQRSIIQEVNTLSTKNISALQLYQIRYYRAMGAKNFDGLETLETEIKKTYKGTDTSDPLRKLVIKINHQFAKRERPLEKIFAHKVFYYENACREDDPRAYYLLAGLYENVGTPQDLSKAWDLYINAMRANYSLAYYKLATTYEDSENKFNVEPEEMAAIEWHQKAAGFGHPLSQYRLYQYYEAIGARENAIKMLKSSAEGGYKVAQRDLGLCYLHGTGVEQSDNQAFFWLDEAAQQQEPSAYKHIAKMHEEGLGTPQNYAEAYKFYTLAYKNDHAEDRTDTETLLKLGQFNEAGYGIEKANPKEALFYYKLAAEKECDQGHYYQGMLYLYGKGVTQDMRVAYDHFQKANPKDPRVASILGIMNQFALGTDLNFEHAERFLTQAAEGNNIQAIEFLAYLHQKGLGGHRNKDKALSLWEKGAALGSQYSARQAGKGLLNQWMKTAEPSYAVQARKYLDQAKEDPAALFYIGYMEEKGIVSAPNPEAMLTAYLEGAKKDHPGCLFKMGQYYETHSDETLRAKSVPYYEKAAAFHYEGAYRALARIYQYGLYNITSDETKAFEHFKTANHLSYVYSTLSDMRGLAEAGSKNALEFLQQENFQRNPSIQAYLASILEREHSFDERFSTVINLYKEAGSGGQRSALRYLELLKKCDILTFFERRHEGSFGLEGATVLVF